MRIFAVIACFFTGICLVSGANPPARYLTLVYTCYLTNIPVSAKQVDCWIPVPSSNDRQAVEILSADLAGGRLTTDSKYGNKMYYRRFDVSKMRPADTLTITLSYKISLSEKTVPEAKQLTSLPNGKPGAEMQIYLADNRLIPLPGAISKLNEQLQLPAQPIRAARQIYDYLIDNMEYNYKAPGAGRGDAVWACGSHTGDCSDYHSVFIGVCRAAGIPADHVFGLPLRASGGKGEVKDWHCWARFWTDGPGWITIDASEADKHPELRDYNFGTLSNIFLTLSHGRDVVLEPAQQGPALNIFAEPYAEVDGNYFAGAKWIGRFREANQQGDK